MTGNDLVERVVLFIPVLLSLTVHEWAHALAARWLGDDTAESLGRLTLNPLAHMDPIGTVVLPLLGVPFGWAKPVPVNPTRFRPDVTMARGLLLTAAAGPASNFVLALLCAVGLRLGATEAWAFLLSFALRVNLALALFNLLPIPPLDGSRIVEGLLPYGWRGAWDRFAMFGSLILLAIVLGPLWSGGGAGLGLGHWIQALGAQLGGQ